MFRQTRTDWRLLSVVDEDQPPHFSSLLREALADQRNYLRQSLFRNYLHRWLCKRLGYDATRGWREPYR